MKKAHKRCLVLSVLAALSFTYQLKSADIQNKRSVTIRVASPTRMSSPIGEAKIAFITIDKAVIQLSPDFAYRSATIRNLIELIPAEGDEPIQLFHQSLTQEIVGHLIALDTLINESFSPRHLHEELGLLVLSLVNQPGLPVMNGMHLKDIYERVAYYIETNIVSYEQILHLFRGCHYLDCAVLSSALTFYIMHRYTQDQQKEIFGPAYSSMLFRREENYSTWTTWRSLTQTVGDFDSVLPQDLHIELRGAGNRLRVIPPSHENQTELHRDSPLPEAINQWALSHPQQLDRVQELTLNGQDLYRISPLTFLCTKLMRLSLENNNIHDLPDELARCVELFYLNVSKNKLIKLPAVLPKCLKLTHFEASYNDISHIEIDIAAACLALKTLNLNDNRIENIPFDIPRCDHLEYLGLSNNCIQTIPDSLFHCEHLKEVNLNNNAIAELPVSIRESRYLDKITLSGNRFSPSSQDKARQLMGRHGSRIFIYIPDDQQELAAACIDEEIGMIAHEYRSCSDFLQEESR